MQFSSERCKPCLRDREDRPACSADVVQMLVGFHQRLQKRPYPTRPVRLTLAEYLVSSLIGLSGFAKFPPGNGITAMNVNADEICGGFLKPFSLEKPDISIRSTRVKTALKRRRYSLSGFKDPVRNIRMNEVRVQDIKKFLISMISRS